MAKLQETCRNIGSDLPTKKRDSNRRSPYSSPPYRKRSPNSSPVTHREKLKSVSGHSPKGCPPVIDCFQPPAISLPTPVISPSMTMPASAPTSAHQSDISQLAAASQYHLLYQKFMYQAELDKLANLTSQQNLVNSFLSAPSMTSMNPMFANAENMHPPVNSSMNAADFAKLAAFFYQKLQQQNHSAPLPTPPTVSSVGSNLINTTTEALLNYKKIFADSKNFLSPFPSPVSPDMKPATHQLPKPQVHECHWVTAEGYCGKKHYSYDDLMLHLRSHVNNTIDSAPLLSSPVPSNTNMCRTQTMDLLSKPFCQPSLRYQPYSLPPVRHQIHMPFSPLV